MAVKITQNHGFSYSGWLLTTLFDDWWKDGKRKNLRDPEVFFFDFLGG
jgi:hypothetical protein